MWRKSLVLPLIGILTAMVASPSAQAALANTRKSFRDSDNQKWFVNIWQNKARNSTSGNFSFFLPHSNEVTALAVAKNFIAHNGGRVFAIDCAGDRYCEGQDPNRMFHDRKYANAIFNVVFKDGGKTAISMHNNEDGGNLQVKADPRNNGKKFTVEGAIQRHYYFGGDRDDFVVINGHADKPTGKNKALLDFMQSRRINVIYEIYSNSNDGSMSYEAVDRGYFYVNIEAEHGHEHSQALELEAVIDFLSNR